MNHIKLFEQYIGTELWYHGSRREELDFNKRSDNVDYNMLGFGLYLTSSKEEAKHYVLGKTKNGYVHTISISENANLLDYISPIPEDIKNKMLTDSNFYEGFTEDVEIDFEDYEFIGDGITLSWDYKDSGYFIYDELKDDYIVQDIKEEDVIPTVKKIIGSDKMESLSEIEIDKLLFYTPSDGGTDYLTKEMVFDSVYHLLQYLFIRFESTKKVSEYMVSYGIDGVTSNQDTTDIGKEDSASTLVCYNPNIYTIEKTTKIDETY